MKVSGEQVYILICLGLPHVSPIGERPQFFTVQILARDNLRDNTREGKALILTDMMITNQLHNI